MTPLERAVAAGRARKVTWDADGVLMDFLMLDAETDGKAVATAALAHRLPLGTVVEVFKVTEAEGDRPVTLEVRGERRFGAQFAREAQDPAAFARHFGLGRGK